MILGQSRMAKVAVIALFAGLPIVALATPPAKAARNSHADHGRLVDNVSPMRRLPGADPVTAAADDLEELLQQHHFLNSGDVDIPSAYNRVILYWHGSLPRNLRELLSVEPWRNLVSVHPARFSPAHLEAVARTAASMAGVASASPAIDYSGVFVQLSDNTTKNLARRSLLHIGVPISFGPAAIPIPADRSGDSPPPYGGDLVAGHPNGGSCSLGVTVTWGHTTGITTANHCGEKRWTGYSSGLRLGTSVRNRRSFSLDVQAVSGNGGLPFVQTGPWNGQSVAGVNRGENPPNGVKICTSGGVTGQVCTGNLMRVRTIRAYVHLNGHLVGPGFWLTNIKTSRGAVICVAQKGDSGSPTYSFNRNGKVTIYGLLVAIDERLSTINCHGNPHFPLRPPPSAPSFRSYEVNIVQALRAIHVSLARDTG